VFWYAAAMPSENPYDPSELPPPLPPPITIEPPAVSLALPPYSFNQAWERGWQVFGAQYPVLLGATGILVGAQVFNTLVQNVLLKPSPLFSLAFAFLYYLCVGLPLTAGLQMVAVRAARGGKATLADLILGYARIGWLLLWTLLAGCVVMAALVPAGLVAWAVYALAGPDIMLAALLVMGVVYTAVSLCLCMRFFYVTSFLLDPLLPRTDLFGAIVSSWRLTAGIWPSLLGLYIVVAFLTFATVFLLCIGVVLLGYPMLLAITGAAYALIANPLVVRSTGGDPITTA
jgi:hypothetical protein